MTARENMIRTIKRDAPQWIPYRYDGTLVLLTSDFICVRPKQGGYDDWNVKWLYTNEKEGSYPEGSPVIDIENIDGLTVPDTDWDSLSADMSEKVSRLKGKDVLPIAYNELALFERVQLLIGFEGFMIALYDTRDELDKLIEKIFAYTMKLTECLLGSGVSGIRFTDDWGMQDRLFISPEDWRFFFKERYRLLYNAVKKRGAFVFQHSCGCIESIMNDIVELGVDVLDPCQPSANDIFALKRDYGDRLSFMGGLDTQTYLTFGTAEEAYRETLKVLEVMSQGGGYIAAPSHTITIPEKNREAMLHAINDYNSLSRNSENG
jgi:uroporphyrinogen decarboxylase